jgi:glycosyltransferase involved in cell wall biosynthesis
MIWRIITGEYPPQFGGVSDYTKVVATRLAACGDEVHVWAPNSRGAQSRADRVTVHRISSWSNPAALVRIDRELSKIGPGSTLVQYVPQSFGCNGMNLLFCAWLYARRRWAPTVMFHEVMCPIRRDDPWRYRLLGRVSQMMAIVVARAATRIYVSTAIWQDVLREYAGVVRETIWLPLPSTIAVIDDQRGIRRIKAQYGSEDTILIGHLSTYPQSTRRQLGRLLPAILEENPRAEVLLLGLGSSETCETIVAANSRLSGRIHASGMLEPSDLSKHISACDLMIQLYDDGACARRTTLITTLAHGRAVLSNSGTATESFWRESAALALAADESELRNKITALIADSVSRDRYAAAGAALYRNKFDLDHCVARMRADACGLS